MAKSHIQIENKKGKSEFGRAWEREFCGKMMWDGDWDEKTWLQPGFLLMQADTI